MEQFLDLQFPEISTEAWLQKATADLKGRTLESLSTEIEAGISLPACLTPSDVSGIPEYGFARANGAWRFMQHVRVSGCTVEEAIKQAKNTGIALPCLVIDQAEHVRQLTGIPGPLCIESALTVQEFLEAFTGPAAEGELYLRFSSGEIPTVAQVEELIQRRNGIRPVCIDMASIHERGASFSQEVAMALAQATLVLDMSTDAGIHAEVAISRIWFRLASGTDFLPETAKYRAFRQVYARWMSAWGMQATRNPAVICGTADFRSMSMLDIHTNLLRHTTIALSVVCGGCDFLSLPTYDALQGSGRLGESLARNISLLLEHECGLSSVADPFGGAYAIEYLTDCIASRAWSRFLEIEALGGYLAYISSAGFGDELRNNRSERDRKMSIRRVVRVGVNQYPNGQESPAIVDPLPAPERDAVPFERIRMRMERHVSDGKRRMRVFLFTYGNLAMRKARANFAFDLFGLAGCEILEAPEGMASPSDLEAMHQFRPDIVVFCSSDEGYGTELENMSRHMPTGCIPVVAGKPADLSTPESLGIRDYIFQRMDTISFLDQLLTRTGIA